jgi:DNA gyrase inhibitor GyrI
MAPNPAAVAPANRHHEAGDTVARLMRWSSTTAPDSSAATALTVCNHPEQTHASHCATRL